MSILVTGAAGFIGCNNVIALNRRGNNVGDAAAVEGDDVVAADEAGCARNENAHRVKISEKEYELR